MLRRGLFCAAVVAVFLKMFVWSWSDGWTDKYARFNVPVLAYPGNDLRSIQTTASCVNQGHAYYGSNDCQRSGLPVTAVYPDAIVPVLNYPSIWVKAYAAFHDDSERFFGIVWMMNTVLLVAAMTAVAWRLNYRLLPFMLFSPITLFAVERGNTDATTFFFTFVPLLLSASPAVAGFFLGVAGALKIFPLSGYGAFVHLKPLRVDRRLILGALLALPLLVPSLLELRHLLEATPAAFQAGYGLMSFATNGYLLWISPRTTAFTIGYVAMVAGAAVWAWRSTAFGAEADRDLAALTPRAGVLLSVSLWVFVATFLLYTNWAYRLMFLAPAWCVVSMGRSAAARVMFAIMCVIFWAPFVSRGWNIQNLACYALVPLAVCVLVRQSRVSAARRDLRLHFFEPVENQVDVHDRH